MDKSGVWVKAAHLFVSYRIHRALGRIARDAGQGVQAVNQQLCAVAERGEDSIAFFSVKLIGLVTCAARSSMV